MLKLPKISKVYLNAVSEFRSLLKAVKAASAANAGLLTTHGRQTYGNYAFTLMCARAHSFARLVPGFDKSNPIAGAGWDSMAMAMLARAIMDLRFTFYYIAVDPCTDEEWEARRGLFDLHDCFTRISLGEKMALLGAEQSNLESYRKAKAGLITDLTANAFFQSSTFTDKQRTKFLGGGGPFFYGIQEFSERAGVPPEAYKYYQEVFSTLAHGHPFALYSLAEAGRQRGMHSASEEAYCALALEAVNSFLSETISEYVMLLGKRPKWFSDAECRLQSLVVEELMALTARSTEPVEVTTHGRFSPTVAKRLYPKIAVEDRFVLPLLAQGLGVPQRREALVLLGLHLTAGADGQLLATSGAVRA